MGATEKPRFLRSRPRLAVAIPLPIPLTTPPVTKMYFRCFNLGWDYGANRIAEVQPIKQHLTPKLIAATTKPRIPPGS